MRRLVVTAAAVVALLATGASSVEAASWARLRFFTGGNATIGWSSEMGSSPLDGGNDQSLRIEVPASGDYAGAYSFETGIEGGTLAEIEHLGFDSTGYLGAGAPRITLILEGEGGGIQLFLSAFYCNEPALVGSDWVTSDFLRTDDACVIWDGLGNQYLGWDAVVAAYGDFTVNRAFLVQDEAATVFVDRLTIGDWMWTRSGRKGAESLVATAGVVDAARA